MKRILVIDDHSSVREVLRQILERAGYEVVEAQDGLEGIQMFRRQPADLVVMDIFMPNKEGLEAISELRRDYPGVKIIAITGGSAEMSGDLVLRVAEKFGADDALKKPFGMDEFLEAVEKALRTDPGV